MNVLRERVAAIDAEAVGTWLDIYDDTLDPWDEGENDESPPPIGRGRR